jgi:GH25 family lysozyme M1 (1,4-beta-N-acetylmuramidase)
MRLSRGAASVLMLMLGGAGAAAQTPWSRPWDDPDVPIIIDPYAGNRIDWDKAITDKRLHAVIHKASEGLTPDPKFVSRADEAKRRGLLWGAYHLGRPGDPIAQADLLLDLAAKTGAKFLAIDIEEDNPAKFMSLPDAQTFMEHVHTKTGRYPAVYVNISVYKTISASYDKSSTFAKGPLWVARFKPDLGLTSKRVWDDYTLWQFSSEINCSKTMKCLYRVPGTATDMDVNVFRGDVGALKTLFD